MTTDDDMTPDSTAPDAATEGQSPETTPTESPVSPPQDGTESMPDAAAPELESESSEADTPPVPAAEAESTEADAAEASEPADEKPARKSRSKKAKAEHEDEDESSEPEPTSDVAIPAATTTPAASETDNKKKWYVIKVASGQEDSIKARLERKIKVESLEEFVSQIVIPVERVTEIKKTTKKNEAGEKVTKEKRVIKERKKYPGYLMAEVEFNDQVLYLFRETPGVGDFVGGGPNKPPAPMTDYEVQRMLGNEVSMKDGGPQKTKPKLKVKIDLERGDKVRLRDGAFAGTEGEVLEIAEAKDDADTPKITVKVQFWGRDVRIDNLEFWQVDKV